MFKGISFYVHDSVPEADDLAGHLQDNGGRMCLALPRADVIIVDRAQSTPLDIASDSVAEIVDYAWVEHCVRQGRRLPFTYQASTVERKHGTGSDIIMDNGPQDRVDSVTDPESSRPAESSPTDTRVRSSERARTGSDRVSYESLEQSLVIPLPETQLLTFSTILGYKGQHPQSLKDYFARFVTAAWTINPNVGTTKLGRDIQRLLPNLSPFSLYSWYYKHRKQADDAMQQALAARYRGGITDYGNVDHEIDRTLRSLSTATSSKRNHPKAKSSLQTDPELLLATRVGNSDVAALLKAQGQPAIPKDSGFPLKMKFFDAVLKWVLEREPTASRSSIGSYIYARGQGRYTPRAFETAYRSNYRKMCYNDIRNGVLKRWQKGELGYLSVDDAAAVLRVNNTYTYGNSQKAEGWSSATIGGSSQANRRTSLRRLGKQPLYAQCSVGLSVEDSEEEDWDEPEDDEEAHNTAKKPRTLRGDDRLDQLFNIGDGRAPETIRPAAALPDGASSGGQSMDLDDDDESDWAMKTEEPEDIDAHPTSDGQIQAMALYQMWFEDFVAAAKLKAETEEWKAKRAAFWRHMVHKFGHDDQHWARQYELRRREVERNVKRLRNRNAP